MTEQEKAALVEWLQNEIVLIQSAQDEIPFGLDYDGENTLKVFNIALAALTTPPAPVIPDGWQLVPVEPTKEMRQQIHPIAEGTCHHCYATVNPDCEENVLLSWRDMLAAAPEPGGDAS